MIIKPKKNRENVERHRLFFFIILIISIIVIYFTLKSSSLTIRPFIHFKNQALLLSINIKFYLLIIIIVFNFGNTYQTLILFYSLLIPHYIYFIISSIRIYFNQNIFFHYFLFIFFFLVLGHLLFTKENKIYYKKLSILYAILLIIILFLLANILAIHNNSFILGNKIIAGLFLSFPIYYFVFYVLNINHKNGLQLYNFLEKINDSILIVLLSILIIMSIYVKNSNKLLTNLLFSLSLINPLCGIKYEIKIIFKSNKRNWRDFNFSSDEDNNINNNLNMSNFISKIKITKSIKWNKTSILYDILRLVFLLFLLILISFFTEKIENDDINIAFLFFAFSISLFLLSKILMYWMELINMTFFFLESDSINTE